MDVIDAGIAVLNMHAPMEVVSKVDVYETYQAYKAFLKNDIIHRTVVKTGSKLYVFPPWIKPRCFLIDL